MNYVWRGQGEPSPTVSVIDDVNPSHADHVAVADAQLLFTAEFCRVGPNLVLTGHDGRHLVIPAYFASEHRAALVAPNGASLSPDLIDLLVGSPTPGQYAQAQPGSASAPIGKVEKVVGNVTVVRNGVSVTLNVGDNVSKSDVIQTGADSQVGIDFPDGTALNLLANTRMALSDFTYDENATSGNSALVSLVEGSFSFIAGKIAHTGQMRMETPVATLGIRGTTGWVAPIATITANVGEQAYTFAVVQDPGTDQTGQYDLIDRSGNVIAHVSAGLVAMLTPSINAPPVVTIAPPTPAQLQFGQQVTAPIAQMVLSNPISPVNPNNPNNIYNAPNPNAPNPNAPNPNAPNPNAPNPNAPTTPPTTPDQHTDNGPTQNGTTSTTASANASSPSSSSSGSSTSISDQPGTTPTSQSLSAPTVFTGTVTTASGPQTVTVVVTSAPTTQQSNTSNTPVVAPPPPPPPTNTPAWNSPASGLWNNPQGWSGGAVPGPQDTVTIAQPAVTVTVDDTELAASLTVASGSTLSIVSSASGSGGFLTATGTVNDAGTIQVNSTISDPNLTLTGAVTVEPGSPGNPSGTIEATGSNATITFSGATVDNFGTIIADQNGSVAFMLTSVTNESNAVITATTDGVIYVTSSTINNAGGTISAVGAGSFVQVSDGTIEGGTLSTGPGGGTISVVAASGANMSVFDGSTDGAMVVAGYVEVVVGAQLELTGAIHVNGPNGQIDINVADINVANGSGNAKLLISGTVTLDTDGTDSGNNQITLESAAGQTAQVLAASGGGTLDNVNATISGVGQIGQGDGLLHLSNEMSGTITGSLTVDTGNAVTNAGAIIAAAGDTLTVLDAITNTGTLQANGGTLIADGAITGGGSAIISAGGTFEIGSTDSQNVTFADASTLKLDHLTDLTGSIGGLTAGDVIDLADTAANTVFFDGSTLTVNGQATTFQIASLPAGDTFAFKSDGASGTDLIVVSQTLTTPTITSDDVAGPSTAREGDTLTASNNGGVFSIAYQWQISSDGTNGWANVSGATNSTYAPQESDETKFIRVQETITDNTGQSTTLVSAASATVLDALPTVTTPAIASNDAAGSSTVREGDVLTASASSGQADNAVTYAWYSSADGYTNPIGTGATYTVTEGNEGATLEVKATTTNDNGATTTQTSLVTATVLDALPTVTTPAIASNDAAGTSTVREGDVLTASASAGQADNAVTYAWYSSADGYTNPIGTGATYTVTEGNEGATLEVKATTTNDNGATTTQTSLVTATVLDALPTVTTPAIASNDAAGTSTVREGDVLTASASAGQADNAVTYAWYSSADGYTNPIGTGATYTVTEGNEGATLEVKATTTNDNGATTTQTSLVTATVLDALPTVTTPAIASNDAAGTSTVREGDVLTASASAGQADNAVTYAWYSSADGYTNPIGTGATYTVTEGNEGATLEVKATTTNDNGATTTQTSLVTATVLDALPTVTTPAIASNDAAGTSTVREGDVLTASASSGQADNAVTYAWYSSADGYTNPIGTGATYTVTEGNEGATLEVKATTTNDNGATTTQTSLVTATVLDALPTVTTPAIASNDAAGTSTVREGDVLTASASAGQADNTVTYAWYSSADGYTNPIGTGATYTVTEGNEGATLEVKATTTNDNGATTTQTSLVTATVLDALPTVTTPAIASNDAAGTSTVREGDVLTASASAGQADNAVTYAWYSSADGYTNPIGTGATYTVTEGNEGATLEVKATTTNDNGATTTQTSLVTATVLDALPTVTTPAIASNDAAGTSTVREGDVLTASASSGQADNAVTYAWYSSADNYTNPIGTGATYTVQEGNAGATIEVKATATNDNGATTLATSAATAPVQGVPPVVTAGGTATFTGGGAAVTLDSALTVTDQVSTTLAGATVTISGGFLSGDTLTINGNTSGTINNGANGTISYSFSGDTLTLSGADTVADYQSALDLVTYSFTPTNGDPTGGGSNTTRTISWVASDGVVSSATATSTLDTVHVAPAVVAGATAIYQIGGPATALDGTLTVSDADSGGTLTGATVSIGTGFAAGDTLNFTNQNGIIGSYDAVHGVLALTGSASLANYQSALDSISFSSTVTSTGGRTIDWTVTDGVQNSTQVTSTLSVTNEDDWTGAAGDGNWATSGNWSNGVVPNASTTAVLGPAGTYPVTSSGAVIVAALTIASTATLDITGGTFTAGSVSNAGTLTFGNATATGTTFNDPGMIQVTSGTTLTLAGSDTITGSIFFIFVGTPQAAPSNSVTFPFFLISDLNPDDPTVTLTIQANGSFAPIVDPSLTFGQNGNEFTITGQLNEINKALNNVTYTPASNADTLTLTVADLSGDTAFRTISLNTSNPASPTLTTIGSSGEITNAGVIDITGTTTLNSDQLLNTAGTVKVETNELLKLDGTRFNGGIITDSGTVESAGFDAIIGTNLNIGAGDHLTIDAGGTLSLSGTTISGGIINNLSSAPGIQILGPSTINGGAQLNGGVVTVASGQTLAFGNATVTGTTFNDPGIIQVASGKTVTLSGSDAITGSVFSIFVGSPQAAPSNSVLFPFVLISDLNADDPVVTLTIQANGSFAPISGSGLTINQSGNETTITGLLSDVNNALNNVTYTPASTADTLALSITDGSGDTAFRTISLNTSNPASPTFTNLGASGEIANAGLVDIFGTTTLNSDLLLNTGTVKVEPNALLKLDGTKFNGGTITDNGTVEIAGIDSITNATLNIGTGDQLTVDPTATLFLIGTTFSGGTGGAAFINDYGTINSTTGETIGDTTGHTATLTVSGSSANFNITGTSSGMVVGYSGVGFMNVEAGATFASSFLNIAGQAGSQGTVVVDGAGTNLSTTTGQYQDILAGNYGNASLTIESGATVAVGSMNIAQQIGSTGTVTIEGPGTSFTATTAGAPTAPFHDILVGNSGTASLTIANQAIVTATSFTSAVNNVSGVTDSLDVNDATLNVSNNFTIGSSGTASATFEGGATVTAGQIFIANNAGGSGSLTVTGADTVVTAQTLTFGAGTTALTIANGAHFDVTGPVAGTGSTTITNGATANFQAAYNDGVIFIGAGTLQLAQSATDNVTIGGFGGGDTLDLSDINFVGPNQATYDSATGILTITDGPDTAQIALQGNYQNSQFTTVNDGSNHVDVIVTPVPVNSVPSGPLTAAEKTQLAVGGLLVSDVAPAVDVITATLSVANGTLTVLTNVPGGLTSAAIVGNGSNSVTLTGSQNAIDTTLSAPNGVVYQGNPNFVGSDTLTMVSQDGAGPTSPQSTVTININPTVDPHLWASVNFPSQPTPGMHLFNPGLSVNTANALVGLSYASSSNYNPANPTAPQQLTEQIAAFDPFFLPQTIANPVIETESVIPPARSAVLFPSIQVGNKIDAEAIIDFVTQDGSGNDVINQSVISGGNNDNTLNITPPAVIENAGQSIIYNLRSSFQQTNSILSSYALAWDQYNSTAQTFSINFQSFNPNGSQLSSLITPVSLNNVASITAAPAWVFGNGMAAGSYLLGVAIDNSTTLQFLGYNLDGSSSGLSFTIQPDLHLYASGATNQIVQELVPTLGAFPGGPSNPLAYQLIGTNYAVAWNETVTDVYGTHDQVEFVLDNGSNVVSRTTFQIADDQAQNVRLATINVGGQSFEVLVYGDNTATHIVEFNASGDQVASIVDPTTQAYGAFTVLGDGRVAIGYDDPVDANGTSQYNFKIFDLRTTGININDSALTDGKDQYVAGTRFNDTFIGENNVGNEYYFVGQNAALGLPPPSDTFTGGQFGANVAVFPDAISNYMISSPNPQTGSMTITNVGDQLHTGSLTITGTQISPGVFVPSVQVLQFGPSKDPKQSSGVYEASAGTLYVTGPLNNSVIIDSGATAEFGAANNGSNGSNVGVSTTFVDTGGTLKLDAPALGSNFTGEIILDAQQTGTTPYDSLDLTNTSVSSASILGTTLTVNLTGGGTQIYQVIGQLGANPSTSVSIPFSSDGAGGTTLQLTPTGSLWGSFTYPTQPTTGVHLYGSFVTTPFGSTNGGMVGVLYGDTTSNYTGAGPDTVNTNLATLDPFLLPYASSVQPQQLGQQVSTTTISAFPEIARQLLLASTSATQTEGIGFFVTEGAGGVAAINQFTFNQPTTGLNNSLAITTSSTPIESNLIGADLQYFTSFENNSSGFFAGTANGAAYGLAYGQYNSATQTYTVNYQIFSTLGTTTDVANPDLAAISSNEIVNQLNVSSITEAPAWFFRAAGSTIINGNNTAIFGSVIAQNNGTANADIQFQTYRENTTSLTGLPEFQITPDLAAYTGATDQITLQAPSPTHTGGALSLQFVPNAGSNNGWSFAWNDIVTDSFGTHDQVEFALYDSSGTLVSRSVFQIADNNPQNIRLIATTINGANVELLAYGDNTGTHVIEFDSQGNQIASLFDPFNHTFDQFTNFGDGRIALVYDNPVDALGSTQYVTHVYDLRTTGLNINDSALADAKDKYIAGTQFNDTFVGENNVNNTYYYVGQNTTGTGPTDSFTGGGGTAWNVAILPDTATDYTITINGVGSATVVSNDLAHAGTLNVTNVQALAFNPAVDPSGNNGTLTATGAELYIIGSLPGNGEPITIDNGSALALGAGIADSGTITFAGASGEAFLITSVDFTGAIAGISQGDSNQIIDLGGFSSQNTDTFTVTPTYNSGTNETTLLVTDTNNSKSESVLLAGNDTTGFTWTASPDGTGGAKVVDPPATVLSARAVGIAGKPINLALANPPAANGGPVTVTVSGLPSDAQLNEGGNLGNGSWSVQTTDLTSLTVLTAFVGAMLLNVSESWANADGTIGTATIADNAEAHTPGSPIFALPSDDTLTGAGGNDLFVFAQPIGNDTIHNFNAASDQIDLMGVVNVASFQDLQIASDSNGDAVITVGSGETITLHGVDASALTASNFVFDQTPTVENSGTMTISDGAVLPLSGIVDNTGVIELNSTGDLTELVITGDGVTLEGSGQIVMSDSSGNEIVGSSSSAVLTNVDNTISGVGQIGTGDGNLSLVNEAAGTINANVAGGTLTLDTGNTIVNFGVLEASNGGTLQVQDAVTGDGSAVIAGGTMEFDAAAKIAVTFNNGAGGTNYGLLILIDPSHFTGDISGFAGTAGDLAHSDGIDVIGINLNSGQFSDSYDSSTGILTLSDGTNTEALEFVDFKGDINNFHFAEDANGTGTLITDPPGLTNSATVSVVSPDTTNSATTQTSNSNLSTTNNEITTEFGPNTSVTVNPGGDHFVFNPGIGAETVANFNWQQDTIELDQFTNAQTTEELQSLIASDAHGDAVIQLGHNDSIVLSGVTTSELQQVIQAGHVLLH